MDILLEKSLKYEASKLTFEFSVIINVEGLLLLGGSDYLDIIWSTEVFL